MKKIQLLLLILLINSTFCWGGESLLSLLLAPAYLIYDHYKSPEQWKSDKKFNTRYIDLTK